MNLLVEIHMAYARSHTVNYTYSAFNNLGALIGNFTTLVTVHIDASAEHHYTALQVDQMLNTQAQAIGVMNRDYPGGAWVSAYGERRYSIDVGGGVVMIFRWGAAPQHLNLPQAPYLFHVEMTQQMKHQALLDRYNSAKVHDPFNSTGKGGKGGKA